MAPPSPSRRFLLLLVAAAVALFAYVASPFAKALLVAATFAAVLEPVHARLTRWLGGRRALSAAAVSLGLLLALVGPVAYLGTVLLRELVGAVQWLRAAAASEGTAGLVDRLPAPLHDLAARAAAEVPQWIEQAPSLLGQGGRAAAALGGIVSATGALALQTLIMVAAVYFLLVEGRTLVRWLVEVTPLGEGQLEELLAAFRGAVVSVVVSALATAGAQAALALLGYALAGVPNPVFFGFLTFVAALVPVVGANIVVIPVAVLHYATGHPLAGILLGAWSVLAVGTVDNLVKPALMRRGMAVHVSLVFLALLGGLATFGPIGFLVGPLSLAFFLASVRIWNRESRGPRPAAEAGPPAGAATGS